jgi:hypothetical protein
MFNKNLTGLEFIQPCPWTKRRANLPSIKTLREIANERARELRKVLATTSRRELETLLDSGKYPITRKWYYQCYNPMSMQCAKLSIASEITECHGVEYIEQGSNDKSPSIEYVNAGDPYVPTLMWTRGRYVVGCWGDIVERGNYD